MPYTININAAMRRYITKKISLLERDCGDLARRCDHFREQVAAPCGTTLALLLTRVQSSNALAVAEELRLMLVRTPAPARAANLHETA
jgi:hypothetical protein